MEKRRERKENGKTPARVQGEKEVGPFTSKIKKPENKIEPSDTHRSDFDAADGDMPASAFADAAELAAKQKPKGTKVSRTVMIGIAVAVGLALVGGWMVSREKEAPQQVPLPKVSHGKALLLLLVRRGK
jgi:hypothetical protein